MATAQSIGSYGPFQVDALEHPEHLRAALRRAGFEQQAIASTVGIRHPTETLDVAMVLRKTLEKTPYHTMLRLFILAKTVTDDEALLAFDPMSLEELIACGLLVRDGDGVRASVKLAPFGDIYCASDFGFAELRGDLPAEHVLGVGPASVTLANLTVRRPGGTIFDLGCGSGIQALLASPSQQRIVASDTNMRALNLAAFNARLNGFENIEWRVGSFFEPAGDELFDTFVANPPFVVSPRSRFIFRDGGLGGDRVSEMVARGAGKLLKEGGFGSMLINWIDDGSDENWESRVFSWVADSGCDALLIRSSETDPVVYAANWLRQSEGRDQARYEQLLDEWIAYYKEEGIRHISSGSLVLRKRSGVKNWQRADVLEAARASGQCGDHLRKIFAAQDFLEEVVDDEVLLSRTFSLHEAFTLDQKLGWGADGWVLEGVAARLSEGLPYAGSADPALIRLLGRCRGDRSLGDLMREIAGELTTEESEIRPAVIGVARKLLRGALLIPTDLAKN